MGQEGHVPPNIYEGGTFMVMSPQYFRSDVDVDSSEHKKLGLCPDPQGKWITALYLSLIHI